MNKTSFFIAGQHAVIEALRNPNRKVLRVFLTEEAKKTYIKKIQEKMFQKTLKYTSNLKKNQTNTLQKNN